MGNGRIMTFFGSGLGAGGSFRVFVVMSSSSSRSLEESSDFGNLSSYSFIINLSTSTLSLEKSLFRFSCSLSLMAFADIDFRSAPSSISVICFGFTYTCRK